MPTHPDAERRPGPLTRLFRLYDRLWRRWHRVQPFDDMLSLSIAPYRGRARILADGTRLTPGDRLGILHFNHDSFSPDGNRMRAARRFRRHFLASLQQLAEAMERDPALKDIKALYGETWIRPHGQRDGFIVEPLPKTWRTRLQHWYSRLLLRFLFPHLARRNRNTWLYGFWLTREQLRAQRLREERTASHAEAC